MQSKSMTKAYGKGYFQQLSSALLVADMNRIFSNFLVFLNTFTHLQAISILYCELYCHQKCDAISF